MKIKLKLISDDIEKATISDWFVSEGEEIKKDQDLFEIVTDKATFDVPAPCDGVLAKIIKEKGAEVTAEDIIAEIE